MHATNVANKITRLERVAISIVAGGVWLLYCMIEDPAPPLPVWIKWLVALLISAWWAFAIWRWTAGRR